MNVERMDIDLDPAMNLLKRQGRKMCVSSAMGAGYFCGHIYMYVFRCNSSYVKDSNHGGISKILRLRQNGLCWAAPVCSSFVSACYGTSFLGHVSKYAVSLF